MSLVGLIIVLLIGCVLLWAVRALMGAFGIGDPISTVVQVLIILVILLWLAQSLGFLAGGPQIHLR